MAGVDRCLEAGRFAPGRPRRSRSSCGRWSHGVASLYLNELLTEEESIAALNANNATLLASFGDTPEATFGVTRGALRHDLTRHRHTAARSVRIET